MTIERPAPSAAGAAPPTIAAAAAQKNTAAQKNKEQARAAARTMSGINPFRCRSVNAFVATAGVTLLSSNPKPSELMTSILLTPPAAEPITLAEAKAYLRVDNGDDDAVITALIAG